MKLKFLALYAVVNISYAGNLVHHHFYSLKDVANTTACEIKIINNSSSYATVYGTFDDATPLIPFNIMPDNLPQYIHLFYNGYCHQSMYLDIVDANGYHVYTNYTAVNSTIWLIP